MSVPPALLMIIGAALLPFLPKRVRAGAAILIPALTLAAVWTVPDGTTAIVPFLGYQLIPLKVDALGRVFATIFALIATTGGIYAYHMKETGQQVAALVYGGGAIGVALAGDFFTLLFFTEMMAVFSTYLVWARRTQEARRAGIRYVLQHLLGGAFLMGGILLYLAESGSLAIAHLGQGSPAAWVMLIGVALSGAIPPLHPWLPDAYPKATVTGAVFMSAFTTKSSVYVLVRLFAGWEILMYLGVLMALYGVVYAVLANDIREILAYHIISQVGYMVAGVGIGTEMALNGTVAHAFSHILYKALLFMGAGAVLHTTGRSKLTELGGIYRQQPWIFWLYMIGAFSISGFPLFNGFISKSMVIAGAGEAHHEIAMLLLLLASIGTFLHTGLKLPYWTWFGADQGVKAERAPRNMLVGMGIAAFLCTLFGIAPGLLYRHLPWPVHFQPYTIPHLVETAQILIFTFVAFWILRAKLAGEAKLALDTDWFFRRPAPLARRVFVVWVDAFFRGTQIAGGRLAAFASRIIRDPAPALQRLMTAEGNREPDQEAYDPDRARPVMTTVLGLLLLVFVGLSIMVLLLH